MPGPTATLVISVIADLLVEAAIAALERDGDGQQQPPPPPQEPQVPVPWFAGTALFVPVHETDCCAAARPCGVCAACKSLRGQDPQGRHT